MNDEIFNNITKYCNLGDNLVEDENYEEAIKNYQKALKLVPDPKNEWEASTWIYTVLGDTSFVKGDYFSAKEYLYDAINCPEGNSNPFILLRLGQCLFELKEVDNSKNFLLQAYMLEGLKIFHEEDDKYFNLIIDII